MLGIHCRGRNGRNPKCKSGDAGHLGGIEGGLVDSAVGQEGGYEDARPTPQLRVAPSTLEQQRHCLFLRETNPWVTYKLFGTHTAASAESMFTYE